MPTNNPYAPFFREILNRLGAHYTLTHHHYQKIAIVEGDYIFASFVPSAQRPGQPLPFRLEWRRQTGGESALRQIEATHRQRIEAAMDKPLEWDYKPGRIAALLNLWYDGPDNDAARIAWVQETAPRFIAALEEATNA